MKLSMWGYSNTVELQKELSQSHARYSMCACRCVPWQTRRGGGATWRPLPKAPASTSSMALLFCIHPSWDQEHPQCNTWHGHPNEGDLVPPGRTCDFVMLMCKQPYCSCCHIGSYRLPNSLSTPSGSRRLYGCLYLTSNIGRNC